MQNKSPSPLREKDRLRPCAAARAFSATEKGKAITSRRQATRLAAPRRHTVMSVAADLHRLPLLSAPRQKRRAQLVARNNCIWYYTMPAAVCQPRGFILRRVGSFCPRRVRRPSLRRTLFCGNSAPRRGRVAQAARGSLYFAAPAAGAPPSSPQHSFWRIL